MEKYLKERITYLREQERLALAELDKYSAGSLERLGKWELIKALTERRRELEDAEQFLINCNNPSVLSSDIKPECRCYEQKRLGTFVLCPLHG